MKLFELINSEKFKEKKKKGELSLDYSELEKGINRVNSKLQALRYAYGASPYDAPDFSTEEEAVTATIDDYPDLPEEFNEESEESAVASSIAVHNSINRRGQGESLVDLRTGTTSQPEANRESIARVSRLLRDMQHESNDEPDQEVIWEADEELEDVGHSLSDSVVEGTPPPEATLRELSERYNIRGQEERYHDCNTIYRELLGDNNADTE